MTVFSFAGCVPWLPAARRCAGAQGVWVWARAVRRRCARGAVWRLLSVSAPHGERRLRSRIHTASLDPPAFCPANVLSSIALSMPAGRPAACAAQ